MEGEMRGVKDPCTGLTPCLFRASDGAESDALHTLVRSRGMITISADVDPSDWQIDIPAKTIRQRVLGGVQNGSIVVMHEDYSSDSTLKALPGIIDTLRQRGYKLVTVPRLLGIPVTR
jgi:peptidoglycan/xylan/chitin deacetylase (PgdA/CDA1 family)